MAPASEHTIEQEPEEEQDHEDDQRQVLVGVPVHLARARGQEQRHDPGTVEPGDRQQVETISETFVNMNATSTTNPPRPRRPARSARPAIEREHERSRPAPRATMSTSPAGARWK